MASIVSPSAYYDRFNSTLNYKKLLCIAGLGVQAAEFNEWQDNAHYELQTFGDIIYPEGTILNGGVISSSGSTGGYQVSASLFWAQGYTFQVPAFSYSIGATESVVLGIYLTTTVVTSNTDPSLRDPAINTKNFNQPGADRLCITPAWCKFPNLPSNTDFYPIITYTDGIQTSPAINPGVNDSAWYDELAHYDYVAHSSYVVNGLATTWVSDSPGTQSSLLNISAGQAHVFGFEFTYNHDQRLTMNWCTETDTVLQEPITFETGVSLYTPRNGNLATVANCHGIAQAVSSMTHGSYSGAQDLIPDSPVTTILYVNQGGTWNGTSFTGGTNYYVTTSWVQNGNYINWNGSGAQPSPGSTYTMVYQYSLSVTATIASTTQISVTGFLAGTVFYFDYTFYLPRIDAVVMNLDGSLSILNGTANALVPSAPQTGQSLCLAQLYNVFGSSPLINVDYYQAVPFYTIMQMQAQIETNTANIATLSLNSTLVAADPTSTKLGIFVDPLTSNVERDLGLTQNACASAIGALPQIDWVDLSLSSGSPYTLPYTTSSYFSQSALTSNRMVNAYSSALAPPSWVQINPQSYRWIEEYTYAIYVEWHILWAFWWGYRWESWSTYVSTSTPVDSNPVACPSVAITIVSALYTANELVDVTWDSGPVTDVLTANVSGYVANSTSAHRYWRLYFTAGNSVLYLVIPEVQFRGTTGGPNLATGGGAYASSYYGGLDQGYGVGGSWGPENAFDGNTGTYWQIYGYSGFPAWLAYDFGPGNAYTVVEVAMLAYSVNYYIPTDFQVQWSDDNVHWYTSWQVVAAQTADWAGSAWKTFAAPSPFPASATITTPAGLMSGTHLITLTGETSGVVGTAVFTATPFVENVVRVMTIYWWLDPIAQTFTINDDIFIPSINLGFARTTTSFVDVSIVQTQLGIPDMSTAFAKTRLYPANIVVGGGLGTTVTFPTPFYPDNGVEYALILQSPDVSAEVYTAVLGQYDYTHGQWITKNVDPTGTMLISSNSNSWLPILGETLTFQINYATFSSSQTTTFPTFLVSNATDLYLMAGMDLPTGTTATFTATLVDRSNQVYPIIPYQPLIISEGSPNDTYSGQVTITMIMTTTNSKVSSVVDGNITISVGTLQGTSLWIDSLILVPAAATNIKVYVQIYESSPGQITLQYLESDGVTWADMTRNTGGAIQIGNGWVNMPFYANGVASGLVSSGTRIQITQVCTDKSLRCMAANLILYFT